MNAYDDNPFFFFVDNPTFPMDVYPDIGKIIELSDTGCDARAPLTSTNRRNNQNHPYSTKTLYSDVSSFQEVFDEKEKYRDNQSNQFNELLEKKSKKVPARDRTVSRNSRRSRTMERDNNEKVDQWERNIEDLKNTLLRDQVNLLDDSSIENILDHDPISGNSKTYLSNSKNSLPRREINRKSRKEEMNVKNEIRGRIPDFAKNSNETRSTTRSVSREETSQGKRIASATRSTRVDRKKRREYYEKNNNEKSDEGTKDFSEKSRRSIDRAVDKDSLSDTSRVSDNILKSTNKNLKTLPKQEKFDQRSKVLTNKDNRESLQRKKYPSLEKRSTVLSNGNMEVDKDDAQEKRDLNARRSSQEETRDRAKSYTRTISKSADFDKAKHRANMAKRYANKTWMKKRQNASEKMGGNEISDNSNEKNVDRVQSNDISKKRAVSKSAGSSTRKREDARTEKSESKEIDMAFDDNSDPSKRTTKILEERLSTNRTRITGVPVSKSFRRDDENNSRSSDRRSTTQSGIRRKDLEKLSAILLSSTLKKNAKRSVSKLSNRNERESRKERNKSVPTNRNGIEETRLDRISSSRIGNEIDSKIRSSNLSKLPSKTEKWVKSKIPVAISRLKKELEEPRVPDNRDFCEFPSRGSSSRTKSTMRENELLPNDERIDESTSVGIISIDKSDFARNENNEGKEIRSRLDEWSKKLEETRRRERDVELKVLKMAKAQKEERKKEFEKRGFRESVQKTRNDGRKDIVDIAATMGKKSNCTSSYNDSRDVIDESYLDNDYAIRKEPYSKPYSLRSSMYARYFPTAL